MQVNINGQNLFKGIDDMMQKVSDTLKNSASTGGKVGNLLGDIQGQTRLTNSWRQSNEIHIQNSRHMLTGNQL